MGALGGGGGGTAGGPRAVLDFPSRLPVVSWLAPGGLHWFLGRVLVVISWRSPGCFCCRP